MENQFDTSSWSGGGSPLGTSPVASLDTPLVQQTKSEIRTLAAEIAELAHSDLTAAEFYEGFLPRLCLAMGASGAAIWKYNSEHPPSTHELVAQHQLPSALLHAPNEAAADAHAAGRSKNERRLASSAHAEILSCVASEGQPILVPPSTTSVDADRPANPIEEALVLVPIRLEKSVEYLVEVTQKSTGGPAAQRGYLRFVAQMGDLFADFVRRTRLRKNAQRLQLVERREDYILQLLTLSSEDSKRQLFVDACLDLLDVNQALSFDASGGKILSSIAVSPTTAIDARNPVFASIRELMSEIAASQTPANEPLLQSGLPAELQRYTATERRSLDLGFDEAEQPQDASLQIAVDQTCHLLGSRGLVLYRLPRPATDSRPENKRHSYCLLSTATPDPDTLGAEASDGLIQETVRTLVAAWQAGPQTKNWRTQAQLLWQRFAASATLVRVLLAVVVLAIGVLPVPQRVSVSALLQPVERNQYYAPSEAVVADILVQEGDWVDANQPLLTLTSQHLDNELDRLEGEKQTTLDRIVELRAAVTRGDALDMRDRDRLENELIQQQTQKRALESQLSIVRLEREALTIRARRPGRVTTWDLDNSLRNRPVKAGAMLLTTSEPNGEWELQLSIPDHRIGLVHNALTDSDRSSLPVRFSLRSQPETVVRAELRHLGFQIQQQPEDQQRFLLAKAAFPAKSLPLKQNGSVASATIECGQVPFGWLVIRDAYTAIRTFFELHI